MAKITSSLYGRTLWDHQIKNDADFDTLKMLIKESNVDNLQIEIFDEKYIDQLKELLVDKVQTINLKFHCDYLSKLLLEKLFNFRKTLLDRKNSRSYGCGSGSCRVDVHAKDIDFACPYEMIGDLFWWSNLHMPYDIHEKFFADSHWSIGENFNGLGSFCNY